MAGDGFSSIFNLLRQSLRLEKEGEWRRNDGCDEDGGGWGPTWGFSSIIDLLRQSLGLEKERGWRRKDGYDEEGGG